MSTIKSSNEDITINADGSGRSVKFQANGVEKASIDSLGNFTSTSIDATKLSGTVPNFTSTGIDDNATSTAITIDASENVGIGVTPESDWGGRNALQLGEQATWGALPHISTFGHNCQTRTGGVDYYMGATANEASQIRQYNGAFTFRVAPSGTADTVISWTDAMTIDNSGFITSGAAAGPHVKIVGVGNGHIDVRGVGTATDNRIVFYNDNGNIGSIQTSASTTSYNTASDYRLKENVVPMSASIDRLKQLKPCNFNFIADATTTVDGFLAHEAQAVVPEAVSGDKDAMTTEEYEVTPAVEATYDEEGNELTPAVEAVMGEREVPDYQGIDQSKLSPLTISALQEAITLIEQLTARVTELENA